MNTLRRQLLLLIAVGVLVAGSTPALAEIAASPVGAGQSSQTFIDIFTQQVPSFAASPPAGLSVSFSPPALVEPTHWQVTMTLSAALDMATGSYTFPIAVTGSSGLIYSDDVAVVVEEAAPTSTTSTAPATTAPPTTSTTTPSTTTAPTTTAPTTTAPTTTLTTASTTTSTSTTTTVDTAPTTTTSAVETTPPAAAPATEQAASTTAPPTTSAPAATTADNAAGPPGAALDPSTTPPLGIVLPLGGVALAALGWGALAYAKRGRITPASKGKFGQPSGA